MDFPGFAVENEVRLVSQKQKRLIESLDRTQNSGVWITQNDKNIKA
jgi:hypothetical protein